MTAAADGEGAVRRVLAEHGRGASTIRLLGTGLDHAAYEVDGELVVRFAGGDDPAARVTREAQLLSAVAAVVPVPVPVPVIVDPDHGCLAYRMLAGRPLLEVPDATSHAAALGAVLGRVVEVLHRQPVGRFAELVDTDDTPLAEWLGEAREHHAGLVGEVPAVHRAAVEAFLSRESPPGYGARVLAHNDLGIEHVLVSADRQVTGIIDWSDAALTDPARDLGLIYRDLGPLALDAALAACGRRRHEPLRDRAELYARCGALEDLSFGLSTGRDDYVTKTLRSLEWLFSPQSGAAARPRRDGGVSSGVDTRVQRRATAVIHAEPCRRRRLVRTLGS